MNSVVPLIICINVGDDFQNYQKLVRSPSISCWEGQHLLYTLFLAIPLIFLFSLLVPLLVTYKLYKSRLLSEKIERKVYLGGLYKFILPYRDNSSFYAMVLIINSVAIVILKELVIRMNIMRETVLILIIIIFYLLGYYIIQQVTFPYKPNKFDILQLVEKRLILIHISNASVAILWILTIEERNKLIGWLIIIYVSLTNLVYIVWWIHKYFGFFKGKLQKFISFFENKSQGKETKKRVSIKRTEISGSKKSQERSKVYLLEKVNKLKILNSLLIERLSEL